MSDKKKETEKNLGLMGFSPDQWMTQAELQALSGHGQHMFISTRPMIRPSSESDSEKTESDEKSSDS